MPRLLLASVVLASLASLKSTVLRGDEILIVNHGFEDQIVADDDFIRGALTGWSVAGDSGVFNPSTVSLPGQPSEGMNVAFIGGTFAGGPISQTLSTNLMVGSYELCIDVGDRLDTSFAGYAIELLAGGAVLAQDNNTMTPNGTFITSTTSFTALASDVNLGQPLMIRISAPNNGSGFQTLFDDVRLTLNAAPISADFDHDGDVDGRDFLVWQRGNSPNPLSASDLAAWQANYGAAPLAAVAAVPEPSSLFLMLSAIVVASLGDEPCGRRHATIPPL
jgi:hypothetical protein